MGYKYRPSRKMAREYAKQMSEIDSFCEENGISQSRTSDSYYFVLGGQRYRVSNHTIAASNRKAVNEFGVKVREKYHSDTEDKNTIYITAGKTRIVQIYNDLKAGYVLDRRGYRKEGGC